MFNLIIDPFACWSTHKTHFAHWGNPCSFLFCLLNLSEVVFTASDESENVNTLLVNKSWQFPYDTNAAYASPPSVCPSSYSPPTLLPAVCKQLSAHTLVMPQLNWQPRCLPSQPSYQEPEERPTTSSFPPAEHVAVFSRMTRLLQTSCEISKKHR